MRLNRWIRLALTACISFGAVTWTTGSKAGAGINAAGFAPDDKIPITTKSDDAKNEFLQGRDLSERALAQNAVQHFDKAILLDPDFAAAELNRATSSSTAKEFQDHLTRAVHLADKASDGERLLILATQAGANGNTERQKDCLEKLVALYPNDERAQFNLAAFYFAQQDMDATIQHDIRVTELAPSFSGAYNILGYAYSQKGEYDKAEQAFKKYTELIPNDPNPYDSYAELLLKMGRYADSVVQYHKALSVDPTFNASRFGLSADFTYMGKRDEAAADLQTMVDKARNDGDRRTAYFGMAVLASDSGKFDQALQAMDKEYAIAQAKNDALSMAADLQAKANILQQMLKYDAAKEQFDRSLEIIEASDVSQEAKDFAKLVHEYELTEIAIGKKDYAAAKSHAELYRQGAEAGKNPAQLKFAHELPGRIALAEMDYERAIAELEQSNLQDPYNLYRLGQAYQGKGDNAKAKQFYMRAAESNSLPALNYAFVRVKALKAAKTIKG